MHIALWQTGAELGEIILLPRMLPVILYKGNSEGVVGITGWIQTNTVSVGVCPWLSTKKGTSFVALVYIFHQVFQTFLAWRHYAFIGFTCNQSVWVIWEFFCWCGKREREIPALCYISTEKTTRIVSQIVCCLLHILLCRASWYAIHVVCESAVWLYTLPSTCTSVPSISLVVGRKSYGVKNPLALSALAYRFEMKYNTVVPNRFAPHGNYLKCISCIFYSSSSTFNQLSETNQSYYHEYAGCFVLDYCLLVPANNNLYLWHY